MRFLIATGIYPPEIGGPAYYAKNLAEALRAKGQSVEIGTYGALKKLPSGVRHVALFLRMLPKAQRADVVVALDTFSAALPAWCAARIFGKPLIVRTGGDFIWEQYVERTNDLVPFPDFYEKHGPFSLKERLYLFLTRFLVKRAHMVFSSEFQKDVWARIYTFGVDPRVIHNAITESFTPLKPERKNYLFYGRDLALRNKKRLLEAFQIAKKQAPEIVLEIGQLPQAALLEKMRSAYAVILPSISEISPNYILDALRCGKPFILTKYSEYARLYEERGLIIDPLDVSDIAEKIVALAKPETYAELSRRIAERPLTRTYEELADDFIAIARDV